MTRRNLIPHRLRRFARAEEGTILAFFGVSLAVLLGLVALSFDMGRIGITRSELQAYADHVALAAAGELDRRTDAITRSTAAAANLITDFQTFGDGGQDLGGEADYTLTFYETLPESDSDAMTDATTDPTDASYVRVDITARNVELTFAAAFAALSGNTAPNNVARASAVAGFTVYACDVTHVMFCLPDANFRAKDHIGEMILLRHGGNGAAWGPGNFGFIDPSKALLNTSGPCNGLSGSKLDNCLLGAVGQITQCFAQRGVDTEPGQSVGLKDAVFNVRFDIYHATMNGLANDGDYAPAPNVIKGIVGGNGKGKNACIKNNASASPDTVGLPRDDCFASGGCDRFGDGDWSGGRALYVAKNYDGVDPHPAANTRWKYYLAEIAAAGGATSSSPILSNKAESGRPQCNTESDPSHTDRQLLNRRILVGAGIDCTANPIKGSAKDVPVHEYVRLFLTEPVGDDAGSPSEKGLWVEIVGSAEGDGGGASAGAAFHDVVQLYR